MLVTDEKVTHRVDCLDIFPTLKNTVNGRFLTLFRYRGFYLNSLYLLDSSVIEPIRS